jgi:tetratricopeptide (TPR) repeat protein
MSYRELGELEKSYDAFEESLEFVEDAFVMNNYAYFLATDKVDIQRALELSSKANETKPDEPNFLDTQALILYLLDRNEEALVLIQRAQEILGPDSADAVFLEREGDILWELEEYDSAKAKWNEAVEAGGGKKRLNEKLSKTTQ